MTITKDLAQARQDAIRKVIDSIPTMYLYPIRETGTVGTLKDFLKSKFLNPKKGEE